MRLRHKKGAEEEIINSLYCINVDKNSEGQNLANYFSDKKPICLELGMGKGKFICEMAKNNQDYNYIGVEKSATIVLKAIENYKKIYLGFSENEMKESNDIDISDNNLRFLCEGVENLDKYFKPHSIDKIYLNFSDPWPKKRHASRRLTHHNFLSLYEKLLKKDGQIEFKTDNRPLFDFSLEEIKLSNFTLLYETHDLHNDVELMQDNIETEYEHKFATKGNNICKYVAVLHL